MDVADRAGRLEVTSVGYDRVEVTDQGEKQPAKANGIVFTNEYAPAATAVQLTAVKTLENRELKNGEFRFLVYESNKRFTVAAKDEPIRVATNGVSDDAGNNVIFDEIVYTKPGTYYYVICENSAYQFQSDIGYDTGLYYVTVEVADAGAGELTCRVSITKNGEAVEKVHFVNVWYRGALQIDKKFVGELPVDKRPESVKVTVSGPNGYERALELTAENGWTATLSDLILGTYTVTEDVESAHVESYWFEVRGAGEVELKAEQTAVVTLTNDYRYIPETGDFSSPAVWAGVAGLSLLGVPVLFFKRRKEEENGAQ